MFDRYETFIKEADGEWYYFYDDGSMAQDTMVKGDYVNHSGQWTKDERSREIIDGDGDHFYYYIGSKGKAVTGWNKIGDTFHYYNYPYGSMTRNNTINGFYIDNYGDIVDGTGWIKDEYRGEWYYFSDGKMTYNDTFNGYHLDSHGKMVTGTGWIHVDSWWYYLDGNEKVVTNWLYDQGNWYYLYPQGSMAMGWIQVKGEWYYLNSSGEMVTGWTKYGDSWYYLNDDGAMAHDTTIDGYYLNDNGEWVPNGCLTKDANKEIIGSNEDKSDYSNWQDQPAKKDFIDNFLDWITGEKHEKTQGQQALEAQLYSMQADQQAFLNEYANNLTAVARGNASADRLNEILNEEAETPIYKGAGKARNVEESSASDSYLYQKYKESLVKDDVLNNSEEIITGDKFGDKKLIAELTKDGSNIGDWSKMESNYSYTNEYGTGKIHYYMNVKTGKVSYYDAKMKISAPKPIRDRLTNTVTDKDGFWIVDLDENLIPIGVRK